MDGVLQFLQSSLVATEGIAAVTALALYDRKQESQWRYFGYYLLIIFICELIGKFGNYFVKFSIVPFFNFFVIPLEFIFFYWLYAYKSFKKPKLFYLISFLYFLSFIPSEYLLQTKQIIFSLNYTFGCLVLLFLIIMEYNKQINSSDIIHFYKNQMFYVNLGVTLFYIGTLPFWTFFDLISKHQEIWNYYYLYFATSGIVMYLLFSISYLWGKRNS